MATPMEEAWIAGYRFARNGHNQVGEPPTKVEIEDLLQQRKLDIQAIRKPPRKVQYQ